MTWNGEHGEIVETNEDNIKAMSTEELATWIWNVQLGLPRTMDDILDWLQSPAGGEK